MESKSPATGEDPAALMSAGDGADTHDVDPSRYAPLQRISMNVATIAYMSLRELYHGQDGVLLKPVLNSASVAEAGFAVGLLRDRVPERVLVGALNLRETLSELPASPFPMPVDFETLARIGDLTRFKSSWVRQGEGTDGRFEVEVLGQGNLCYDVVIAAGKKRSFFKPGPIAAELLKPAALDLVMSRDGLLRDVVELVKAMGIVYNPHFYMTIEDWQFEHAADSLGELEDLF
jgi:hypothetical protein